MIQPQVSVAVPCYNGARTLPKLLQALTAQETRRSFEVVVVDDGSTDATVGILAEWTARTADVTLRAIHQENAGPSAARNRAAQEARGRWLLYTDADCVPRPDWVETMARALEGHPEVGAVGGTYDIANPDPLLARLVHAEIRWRHRTMGPYVRFVGSYNLGLARELFLELGGFSTRFRNASGEDNDLSYRILARGRKLLFCPEAVVAHHHPEKLLRYLKEQYRHGRWRATVYRLHPEMASGDDYTKGKDVLEVPLALLVTAAAALSPVVTGAPLVLSLSLCAFLGLQVRGALRVAAVEPGTRSLAMAGMTGIRAFARAFGLVAGVMCRVGRAP